MAAVGSTELAGWAALVGGMGLSFLYSGMETGTYALNKIRLELLAESGGRRAARLRSMRRDPNTPLIVVLIGNNLANYLASAGMVLILTSRHWAHPTWYAVAILTPAVFVFCELLPKNLFHRHSEVLTYLFSGFLQWSRWVFTAVGLVGLIRALVWAVIRLVGRRAGSAQSGLGRGEQLGAILAEGRASGALTHTQSIMAERVVNLGRLCVGDVMVPLEKAALVSEDVTARQLRELLREQGHPRVGVYSGERQNIVGVLDAYDALLDETSSPPRSHVRPHLSLPQSLEIIPALFELQERRQVLAFVVSEAGHCVGVVSVKDLVEQIVGELEEW